MRNMCLGAMTDAIAGSPVEETEREEVPLGMVVSTSQTLLTGLYLAMVNPWPEECFCWRVAQTAVDWELAAKW